MMSERREAAGMANLIFRNQLELVLAVAPIML